MVAISEVIGGNEYILASTQLPSQTKITFSPTSSEVKVKFKYGTSAWTWHGHSICITKPVMVSETYYVDVCDGGDDKYRFGFNGQEKVNEISGIGNHNTAQFWEYDTRVARRWNLDPVDQISISNYAVNGLNPIVNIDPLGDDWFKNGSGDIRWDNSQKSSITIDKKKWSNIGSTINIRTNSYINNPNDLPLPESLGINEKAAGDKLTTNISITGNYENGKFKGFDYAYSKPIVGATFDIESLQGVPYPNKNNTPPSQGSWDGKSTLSFSAHYTTPDIETMGLKLIGSNVDVNQELSISLEANGLLNIGINHGSYPSVNMTISSNKSNISYYNYQQHSFITTHGQNFDPFIAPIIITRFPVLGRAFVNGVRKRQSEALILYEKFNKRHKRYNKAKLGEIND